MKAKSDLKAALEALQVRKPLKLPSSAPTFTPPPSTVTTPDGAPLVPAQAQVVPATPVHMETLIRNDATAGAPTVVSPASVVATPTQVSPQTEVTSLSPENQATSVTSVTSVAAQSQVAAKTEVPAQALASQATPVARTTQVGIETPVATRAVVGVQTEVNRRTLVTTPTPVHAETQVGSATRGAPEVGSRQATEQDSAVALEAQAAPKLQLGYTRLPNVVLMRMVGGDLIRSEMQVVLLVARLTISYQRRFSPISKAVIERQTGLRGPAVLHALAELVAKGLLEKIPGDQNRPNQFGLIGAAEFLAQVSVQTQVAASTQAQVAPATTAPVAARTPALVPGATHFKDSEIYKNPLSLLPEKLREYFGDLKPARKRESEWKAFQELQGDYPAEDIADSLAFVLERGIGEGEHVQPCHSPMAFLARAISDVLPQVEARRQKARDRSERDRIEAEAANQRREQEAREAQEWAEKERAFSKAFPGEERQQEALTDLLRGLPFRPNSSPGRLLGIGKWWDGLPQHERRELTGE